MADEWIDDQITKIIVDLEDLASSIASTDELKGITVRQMILTLKGILLDRVELKP